MIRVGEPLGEIGVVGQYEQTAGVQIESAHRRQPGVYALEQVVNRGPALGIAVRRQVPLRLIEQDVSFGRGANWFPVERYATSIQIDPLVRIADHLSVHSDAAAADPAPGFGSRTDSGFGERSLERFGFKWGRLGSCTGVLNRRAGRLPIGPQALSPPHRVSSPLTRVLFFHTSL